MESYFLEVLTDADEACPLGKRIQLPELNNSPRILVTGDASPYRRAYLSGEKLPPRRPSTFVLGREGAFAIGHWAVSRRHALVRRPLANAFTIEDSHSTNGTFVNGISATTPLPLRIGDLVDLGGGVLFRVGTSASNVRLKHQRSASVEAVAADPENDACWLVWADELMEAGDPLGRWLIAKRRSKERLGKHLGPLAADSKGRNIEMSWNRFGFLRSLRIPSAPDRAISARWLLHNFELVEAARLLVHLEVAVAQDIDVDPLLDAMGSARLPSSLRSLRLSRARNAPPITAGSLMNFAPRQKLDAAITALRKRCPRLSPTNESLFAEDQPLERA